MISQNKTKTTKRIFAVFFVVLMVLSVLFSTLKVFQVEHDEVRAEGLSTADSLLAKTLRVAFEQCLNKNILLKKPIDRSDKFTESDIFNTYSSEYDKDGKVSILYKYGTGNTIKDANLSCKQLFSSFPGKGDNVFAPYNGLGGHNAPYVADEKVTIQDRNLFLEGLGYTPTSGANSSAYCAQLAYKVTINSVNTTEYTSPICVNVANGDIITATNGKKITEKDISYKDRNLDDRLSLSYSPHSGKIELILNIKEGNEANCSPVRNAILKSEKLQDARGKSAKEFFESFFRKIEESNLLNTTRLDGYTSFDAAGNVIPCQSKTLSEALGANLVKANTEESLKKSGILNTGQEGSDNNNALIKSYEYSGTPDYDKLMKYYIPNYVDENAGVNDLIGKAYYWYYLLKDVFQGISVGSDDGCSSQKPSSGYYLQYYRDVKDSPGRREVQYCLLDEPTLNNKSNEVIMERGEAGKVNSVSEVGYKIYPLDAKTVLSLLNKVSLPSVCAHDSSFPLCKATPIECKDDPNKEGCKDITNASATEEDTENGEQAACMQNAGALGWMICPMLYGLRDMAQGIFEHAVEPLLRVHDSVVQEIGKSSGDSPMYKAWSFFRNVANILFVIALLFVIFSQVTGFGIDNYGIKKILPKLIITAIIVNFSYLICGALIDISHLVGDGVKNIFENIAPDIATSTPAAKDGPTFAGSILQIVAVLGGAAGATVGGITLANAFTSGSLLAVIFPILSFVGAAAVAAFFAMLMLGLRQALIIIMIALSPVAFVLYAIPNTNGLFKKWLQLFRTLLMLYPVYCFMVGGGFMAANLIVMASKEFFMQLIAGLVSLAPYFMVPSMTKNALKGFDSAVGGIAKLQALTGRAGTALSKKITSSEPYKASVENKEYGKLSRFADKYKNYSSEELASLNRNKRRRLTRAIGVIGKDAEQTARLGAAMSQFRANTDPAMMDTVGISAMRTEDENQKERFMVQYANSNLSYIETLERLNAMQDYDYSDHSAQDNHNHDIEMSALQSHLLSTKDGQKAYNEYLQGKEIEVSKDNKFKAGKSSDRARAVLARDFVANHSNLKDKYQIAFAQMQSMQGNGTIEELDGTSAIRGALSATRSTGLNDFANRIDFKDFETLGKADAKELTRTRDAQGRVAQSGERIIDRKARENLEKATKEFAATIQNDPTRAGSYYSEIKELVADRTGNLSERGTDIDSLGDRTLVVRGSDGGVVYSANFETGRSNSSNNGARGTSGGNNGSNGNNGSSNSGNNGTSSGNSTSGNNGGSGSNGGQQQKPPQQNP